MPKPNLLGRPVLQATEIVGMDKAARQSRAVVLAGLMTHLLSCPSPDEGQTTFYAVIVGEDVSDGEFLHELKNAWNAFAASETPVENSTPCDSDAESQPQTMLDFAGHDAAYVVEQISAMRRHECCSLVVVQRPDEESLRFHFHRLADGRWLISLQMFQNVEDEFPESRDWIVCSVPYVDALGPRLLRAEIVAYSTEEIKTNVDLLVLWAWDKAFEDDRHAGAEFLRWVRNR